MLIPGLNDNIDELNSFINQCKKAKVKNIIVDIEHFWLYSNKNREIPLSLINAAKYFENLRNNSSEFKVNYIQVGKDFLLGLVK